MMATSDPRVIVRMGTHAEKDYLDKTIHYFDGIMLGANLVEATPGATASLMLRFCGKKVGLPYYIDPMTYAFGAYLDDTGKTRTDLDWIKSEQKRNGTTVRDFKKSYRGLSSAFGQPFSNAIERKKAVSWTDFEDDKSAIACCQTIADYQHDRLADEFAKTDELKPYADKIPRPSAIFAPYFYIEPHHADKWLDLALRLAKLTAEIEKHQRVHAVICVDESFLANTEFVSRLEKELPKTGVAGVWLWFSALYEDQAETDRLFALRSLVESLAKKIDVFNMHGGYFSLALSRYGLDGVSHGIGYGEQKDVLPVIGQSTPTVRYYLPDVHKRFGVPQIQRCFEALKVKKPAQFHSTICDCTVCRGVVKEDVNQFKAFGDMHYSRAESKRMAQTPAAAKRCRFHFLLSRIRERDWMKSASVAQIVKKLNDAKTEWEKQPSMRKEVRFLERWADVLK